MTQSSVPPHLEGSHAPNALEVFWDTHRRTLITVAAAAVFGLGLYYAIKYYQKRELDAEWSQFAASAILDTGYVNNNATEMFGRSRVEGAMTALGSVLLESLEDADAEALTAAIEEAKGSNREPWLLWVAARKAVEDQDWDRAVSLLDRLEQGYPQHTLCAESPYPLQYREQVEQPDDAPKPKPGEDPELEEAIPGSMVKSLRGMIAAQRSFETPAAFEETAIPEGAPKVRFKLEGDWGEFVIALFPEQAPVHVARFLKLARQNHWKGMRVDEVHRKGQFPFPVPEEFHLGLPTSRDDDRTKWVATEPSEEPLEFEYNDLSMFPGSVSGRPEAEGQSSGERFWVSVSDGAQSDGTRVVFGRVVEGMENLENVVDAGFATENEENQGRGKPTDDITVESVIVEVDLPGGGEDEDDPPKQGEKDPKEEDGDK